MCSLFKPLSASDEVAQRDPSLYFSGLKFVEPLFDLPFFGLKVTPSGYSSQQPIVV